MLRIAYAILIGLVGAGIAHIVMLLMLPLYSEKDAWTVISEAGPAYVATPVKRTGRLAEVLSDADPMFETVVCRFDLADGTVRIAANGKVPFWSMSVFDRRGLNIYSLNDRSSTDGALDIVVATPLQMIQLRKAMPDDYADAILIEADTQEGIAVLRVFVPDPTWQEAIDRYLATTRCEVTATE